MRVSNKAALSLYRDVLKFRVDKREIGYYADGEDAFAMKLDFKNLNINKKDEKKEDI